MSERWVQISKKILDQLKDLEKSGKGDRLEQVSSMRIALGGLEMSLQGWKRWVNNPTVMAKFKQEDLKKMNKKLIVFARAFIEYDLEATELGMKRGLKAHKKTKKKIQISEAYVT